MFCEEMESLIIICSTSNPQAKIQCDVKTVGNRSVTPELSYVHFSDHIMPTLNESAVFGFCFLFHSVFLAEQFESLQSHLDTMMPAAKKPFLQQFYSQVL